MVVCAGPCRKPSIVEILALVFFCKHYSTSVLDNLIDRFANLARRHNYFHYYQAI